MKASTRLVVMDDRAEELRCEPPLTIRRCDDRFLIVGSAAAPVGGDQLALDIDVRHGSTARIASAAATMIWPGAVDAGSSMRTAMTVAEGARIEFIAEPLVAVAGSRHVQETIVSLDATGSCLITEEIVLGRYGEPSGELTMSLRIDRGKAPLLHQVERFGPGLLGAGSLARAGAARHVVMSAVVGGLDAGEASADFNGSVGAAWLPLASDAAVLLATGPDRPTTVAAARELASGRGCEPTH